MMTIEEKIKTRGQELGFDLVGIGSASPPDDYPRYLAWLEKGHSAKLWYLQEENRKMKRGDLKEVLPDARSVISIAVNYANNEETDSRSPKFARYGWGRDYHKVLQGRLKQLARWLEKASGIPFEWKIYVDTGPILERSLAQRAGLGWIGKNTCLIDSKLGSYLFLGELITTLSLEPDDPGLNHCSHCTKCLDACPTGAFRGPYELDANRCISYHTLESPDEEIPETVSLQQGGWIAGCDICQEVCPWNKKAPNHQVSDFQPRSFLNLEKAEIENLTPSGFRKLFEGSAFLRMGLKKLQRNMRSALTHDRQGSQETGD